MPRQLQCSASTCSGAHAQEPMHSSQEGVQRMDVTIEQTSLSGALRFVGRAVASRTTLPVLTNVLLHAESDGVRLTGADGEIGAVTTVAAAVAARGRAAVPARLFADYAAQLPADPVRLTLDPAKP